MNIAVRYYTRGGNTQKVAEAIANALEVEALDLTHPVEKADVLFLGASMYAFTVDSHIKEFVRSLTAENAKRIVVFSTSASDTSTHKKIKKCIKDPAIEMLEQHLSIPGSFLNMNKGRPNEDDLAGARTFAQNTIADLR